jgi:hypothetical protein
MVSLFHMYLYTTSQLCMKCLTGLTPFLDIALRSKIQSPHYSMLWCHGRTWHVKCWVPSKWYYLVTTRLRSPAMILSYMYNLYTTIHYWHPRLDMYLPTYSLTSPSIGICHYTIITLVIWDMFELRNIMNYTLPMGHSMPSMYNVSYDIGSPDCIQKPWWYVYWKLVDLNKGYHGDSGRQSARELFGHQWTTNNMHLTVTDCCNNEAGYVHPIVVNSSRGI